jgi:glycerophosphoryl diester phosphodiesterase
MFNFVPGPEGTYSKLWAVAFSMKQLTPERVREFREAGLQTWCYCPDTEEQVAYALECGVKVMTCNNPYPAMRVRDGSAG